MMILQSKSHILARYNFAMHDAMALRLRRRLFKINYLSYLIRTVQLLVAQNSESICYQLDSVIGS